MSSENVELARRLMAELPLDDLAGAVRDPERVEAMAAILEPVVDSEFEVVRIGPEYTGEGIVYRGLGGFSRFGPTGWNRGRAPPRPRPRDEGGRRGGIAARRSK